VEVFTGTIPFEERENEVVVFCISQGRRLGMPGNDQAVGLAGELWKLQLLTEGSRNTTYDGRDFEEMDEVRCTR